MSKSNDRVGLCVSRRQGNLVPSRPGTSRRSGGPTIEGTGLRGGHLLRGHRHHRPPGGCHRAGPGRRCPAGWAGTATRSPKWPGRRGVVASRHAGGGTTAVPEWTACPLALASLMGVDETSFLAANSRRGRRRTSASMWLANGPAATSSLWARALRASSSRNHLHAGMLANVLAVVGPGLV